MTASTKKFDLIDLQQILKYTFGIIPIVAGADKFLNLLADWQMYIPGFVENILPFETALFMAIVGVIEITAGIIVLTKTETGAYIVSAWLLLIALTLLLSGQHIDVAVRDIVMAVAAFVLARMTALTAPPEGAHNFA